MLDIEMNPATAEDGTQLTYEVWFVLPVVPDEHCCEVMSAWEGKGGKALRGATFTFPTPCRASTFEIK